MSINIASFLCNVEIAPYTTKDIPGWAPPSIRFEFTIDESKLRVLQGGISRIKEGINQQFLDAGIEAHISEGFTTLYDNKGNTKRSEKINAEMDPGKAKQAFEALSRILDKTNERQKGA